MKVSLDSLDEEIKKELENFNAEVINAANDSFQETAKEAAEMLKKGGPYQERTGAYTKYVRILSTARHQINACAARFC